MKFKGFIPESTLDTTAVAFPTKPTLTSVIWDAIMSRPSVVCRLSVTLLHPIGRDLNF